MATARNIEIPYPDVTDLHLRVAVGACRLFVAAGDGPEWVTGTYTDPSSAAPLNIEQTGGTALISQKFNWPEKGWSVDEPPRFNLALGKARPYALTLEVGANEGEIELGGLPLTRLDLKHGAGKLQIAFSAPNPQPLSAIHVSAGATSLALSGLGNANFAELSLEGGAAAFQLDFAGSLQRDARARIVAGVSEVTISTPAGTAVKIATETVLGSVTVGDGLTKREGAFWTEGAVAGHTPVLAITANVTMGSINLVAER